jgi:hypothetical protein
MGSGVSNQSLVIHYTKLRDPTHKSKDSGLSEILETVEVLEIPLSKFSGCRTWISIPCPTVSKQPTRPNRPRSQRAQKLRTIAKLAERGGDSRQPK